MNKKVCLILLAAAVQQVSVLARTTTGEVGFDMYERHEARKNANQPQPAKQETADTKAPTPTLHISQTLSENPDYRAKLQKQLQKLLEARRGSVDVTDIETTIITEYTPALIQPGNDAFKELDEAHEKLAADYTSLKYKTALAAIASFGIGFAVSHLSK